MPPINPDFVPHRDVPKARCATCGIMFRPIRANQKYHDFACKERAELERRKRVRAESRRGTAQPSVTRDTVEWNPTPELLTAMAGLIAARRAGGASFAGTVPDWTPGNPDIAWGQAEDGTWSMVWMGE